MKDEIVSEHKIILFDGVCNLCNSSVLFVIKRDPKNHFRFAALQSEIGKKLLTKHQIDPENTDSIVLIEDERVFVKSTAALRIARHLSGGWPMISVFFLVPKFIRNWIYDLIAKNRYRWYGKKDQCMIPTKELQAKFL
ncbi:MAG: thiol-disulfide oxidoreductase DCC family protein [Flavobacteriaceae bacterium]|nr:thiol-disulfide oxidoreductase DCC family protein [Flavobacteriaceae bacterium]